MSVKYLIASGMSNFVVYMTWFGVPVIFLLIVGSSNIGIRLLPHIRRSISRAAYYKESHRGAWLNTFLKRHLASLRAEAGPKSA